MTNLFKIPECFGSNTHNYILCNQPTVTIMYSTGEHCVFSPVKNSDELELDSEEFFEVDPVKAWSTLYNMAWNAKLPWNKRTLSAYGLTIFDRKNDPEAYDELIEVLCDK